MRIISGKYKGQVLVNFQASHLRPTTDRVKESVFNKLASYIQEARVLDLFAGTGNLSIESCSRGAEQVVAVEKSPKSLAIISKNLNKLKIGNEIKVIKRDVFQFLKESDEPPFDIILIDPPFTQKIAHEAMLAVESCRLLKKETLVVIESSKSEKIEENYVGFELLDKKSYGDKFVSYFKYMGI